MVSASTQLEAFLESGLPMFMADLYTFTLVSGQVLYYTSFRQTIFYGNNNFTGLGPYIDRSSIKLSVGLEASELDVVIQADPTNMIGSQSILLAIAQGKFSGASVIVRRAFLTVGDIAKIPVVPNLTGFSGGTGDGTIVRFAGVVGAVTEVTPLSATLQVRDQIYIFNRPCPKNVFQPGCWHTFCDAGCTLSASDFTTTGVVGAGSTTLTINTGLTQDSGIQVAAPTAAPSLSLVSNAKVLPWEFDYVVVTYVVQGGGETTASPESSQACTSGNSTKVASPPNVGGMGIIGWNCYVGDGSGNEQLQNTSPIAIGTPFTVAAEGVFQSGQIPPQIASTGYWALGRISFTSGVNNLISAAVAGSNPAGAISLVNPLPATPGVGDTFSIFAGCAKTMAACQTRKKISLVVIDNTANFTGYPAVPTPEVGT